MLQFFSDVNKQPSLEWRCVNWKRKLWRKVAGEIKYQNLYSFKEGLILLCQSILETRITHLHGSAHFTIPLNINY